MFQNLGPNLGPKPVTTPKECLSPQTSDIGDHRCAILRPLAANASACDCSALSPAERWRLVAARGDQRERTHSYEDSSALTIIVTTSRLAPLLAAPHCFLPSPSVSS